MSTTETKTRTSLLFVDDEPEIAFPMAAAMRLRGYVTEATTSPAEALELARDKDFDVSIVDLVMPEMNGITVVRELLRCDPRMRCLILTAFPAVDSCDQAYRAGVVRYLKKPIFSDELHTVVHEILDREAMDVSLPEVARIVNPDLHLTEDDVGLVSLPLDLESTTLATFKREAIGRYLKTLVKQYEGCPKKMALKAGVCLTTMYRLLNEHDIPYARNPNLGRPRRNQE